MIPSSNMPKLCSNNQCRKVTKVPRQGWVCENNLTVDLCEGCYVSFSRGKFCEIYHGTMSDWSSCISCTKPIHYGCLASQNLYVHVRSEPRVEIKCLDCTPQHEILMPNGTFLRPNFEGPSGNSTGVGRLVMATGHVASPDPLVIRSSKITPSKELTNATPLARVPPIKVGKGKEKVYEKGDEHQRRTPPPLFLEYNKGKSSTTTTDQAKACNRKPRSEHRYVPRLTEQELKQMSRGSKVKVTPLFEKVLTVSDTGKIGRLVIPKNCAEGHFPPIHIPEGEPLVFQDLEGKDWEFHYRYWPNNNSRMYVLEGFNYYVTSTKLQPGDTVMFSRLDPKGKLVMGHRKATSASSSSQVGLFGKAKTASPSNQKDKMLMRTGSTSNGVSKGKTTSVMRSTFNKPIRVPFDVVGPTASVIAKRKRVELGMVTKINSNGLPKDKPTLVMPSMISHENSNDQINVHSDVVAPKASIQAMRKSYEMGMITKISTNGISKDKTTSAMPSMVSHENPNDPINVHSDVVGLKASILDKKKHFDMGKVTEITTNGFSKDKTTSAMPSMVSHGNRNDLIIVHSDMVGPKASILAKRKCSEMGTTTETTTIGILKDKTTSAMPHMVTHENPNHRTNVHSDVLGSKSSIHAKKKNHEKSMLTPSTSKRVLKPRTILALPSTVSQKKPNNPTSVHSNVVGMKVPIHRKRKLYDIGLTSKSTSHEDKMANLALSFQGGQELIQSCPGSNPPSKMFFNGVELISYKDDPIIGRPSMFTKLDQCSTQWAQCEKCYKWRKVSVKVKIPANWTCRQNHEDILRSRCSAKEELTRDMINNIFPTNSQGSSKKIKTGNVEPEQVETVEESDVVVITPVENAVVALPEPLKANKKHPRHRPGCACIVCMQAPSGSKHKPSCECCSCTTGRRRRLLNPRRAGKKRSKNARRKLEKTKRSTSNQRTQKALTQPENVPNLPEIGTSNLNQQMGVIDGSEVDQNEKNVLGSGTKYQFDLNLLPEPDEDDIDHTVVPN